MHNSYYAKNNKWKSQVIKTKTYKPNKNYPEMESNVIISKATDVTWQIVAKYASHFILKNLPLEFCVWNTNLWNPHPVKPTSIFGSNGIFTELAESKLGPQIAIKGNMVATQFYILKENPETITLLNNFIDYHMSKLFESGGADKHWLWIEEDTFLISNIIKSLNYFR